MSLSNLFLLFKEEFGLGLFGLSCGLHLQIVGKKKNPRSSSKYFKNLFEGNFKTSLWCRYYLCRLHEGTKTHYLHNNDLLPCKIINLNKKIRRFSDTEQQSQLQLDSRCLNPEQSLNQATVIKSIQSNNDAATYKNQVDMSSVL